MYKESKPMLAPSELVEHLEFKGVKFELISKEDAQKQCNETTPCSTHAPAGNSAGMQPVVFGLHRVRGL